jgi:hypothetical protein
MRDEYSKEKPQIGDDPILRVGNLAASRAADAAANVETDAGEEQKDPMKKIGTVSGSKEGEEGDIDTDKEFKKLKRQAARK